MRLAIIVFGIILLSNICFGATIHADDYARLDSILMTGNPEAAMAYWSTVCNPVSEDNSTTACETTTEELQNLLDFVALFEAKKLAYKWEVIADRKGQSASYKESYAGSSAASAFQAFLGAADNDDWFKAIIYIQTARFFKIRFLKRTLVNAQSYYQQADKYFGEGNFDSADSALKAIRYDAGDHPALIAFADTINHLQKSVDQKLLEIKRQQYYWERTASVDSRFSFSFSAGLINQPGSNSFPLVMSSANSTIQVEVTRVSPNFRPGVGLQAWYQLNKRISVGGGVDMAKFTYTSVHTLQLIFFDFDVAYSRAFVGGQYFLRSAVGLRPYLNLGLGVMRYKYDQFDCVVKLVSSEYETFEVAAGDFSTGEAKITFGTQFVPNSNSRWAITSELSWYKPFKEHTFLPLPRSSFSLRIDLLM